MLLSSSITRIGGTRFVTPGAIKWLEQNGCYASVKSQQERNERAEPTLFRTEWHDSDMRMTY